METVPPIKTKLNAREMILFIIILVNAIFFIFYQLGKADSYTDGSHYSMRAVGYLDYLVPYLQTAPIQWFEKIPWWGRLSFHDAPPLVFIIQNVFFRIFGENTFVMRLPSAMAGLGTLILLYLTAKKIYGKHVALISMDDKIYDIDNASLILCFSHTFAPRYFREKIFLAGCRLRRGNFFSCHYI